MRRGHASTLASLDPPLLVSASTSPSVALGRRGVDRPARARVPLRPRSTTKLPGPASRFRWLRLLPFFPPIGSPSNCWHPPPSAGPPGEGWNTRVFMLQ